MTDIRGGYTGRTLRVDLSTRQVFIEDTPEPTRWLGARGWNALVAWQEVPPGVGPFDAENRIVFSAGPLVGTGAPTAGRTTVSTISPRGYPAPMWTWSSMGGYFGAELKYAGYDSIIVQGQADGPCYLLIEDDKVTIEDARPIWGKGVFATQQMLKARHGQAHQIAAIGPAGEHRVRYACIIHRLNNAVGNAGFGGVLGAKNLKAIAVRGTRGVQIAAPARFLEAVSDVWHLARGGMGCVGRPDAGYPVVACTHGCSVKCWARVRPIQDRYDTQSGLLMRTCNEGVWAGGIRAPYKGISANGEQLDLPGAPGLGPAGMDISSLATDMGLTTWAFHTFGNYLGALRSLGVEQVLGERLDIEDPNWWRDWITAVAHRQGVGNEYAEGLARFYDRHRIGPAHLAAFLQDAGSRGHGWHRDGRAMERHHSPFWEYAALLYAVSTRDVTPSTHGFLFLTYAANRTDDGEPPELLQRLAERVYGSRQAILPGDEHIEHVVAWHQLRSVIKDSLGVCDWVYPILRRTYETREEMLAEKESIYGDTAAEATLYEACTGIDMDIETMEHSIAERIVNLERCVDIRNHGRSRELDEAVIPHFQWPEKTDGSHISKDASEFRALLDRFYGLRGWDRESGWPTWEKLTELGLSEAAETLQALMSRAQGALAVKDAP